jgi:hypothetical protein
MTWQPIDTCPIGTDVLTWDEQRGVKIRRRREIRVASGAKIPAWYLGDDYDDDAQVIPPTHWMPLPKAPGEDPAHAEPTAEQRKQAETWMREVLSDDYDHDDLLDCGEVNRTRLAEECADALDLALDDADATIPEWVFDLAHEVAEWWGAEDDSDDEGGYPGDREPMEGR